MPMTAGWRQRERIKEKLHDECRAHYLAHRDEMAADIVRKVAPHLSELNVKEMTPLVSGWMASWEVPKRAAQRKTYALLDPEYQLKEEVENVSRLKSLMDAAIAAEEEQPTPNGANTVRAYRMSWVEGKKRLEAIEKDMGITEKIILNEPRWSGKKGQLVRRLKHDYKGKGAIYTLLIDRLASLAIALERLEEDGRMESQQYKDFQSSFTEVAAQIQKHTESMKQENFDYKIEEIGGNLMRIVETVLMPTSPALLTRIYDAIEHNAGNLMEGKLIQLPERASA